MDKLNLHQQMRSELLARQRALQDQRAVLDDVEKKRDEIDKGLALIAEEIARYDESIKALSPKTPVLKE